MMGALVAGVTCTTTFLEQDVSGFQKEGSRGGACTLLSPIVTGSAMAYAVKQLRQIASVHLRMYLPILVRIYIRYNGIHSLI